MLMWEREKGLRVVCAVADYSLASPYSFGKGDMTFSLFLSVI